MLASLWQPFALNENWLVPVVAGALVSGLILAVSLACSRRSQLSALDVMLMRGQLPPATPAPGASSSDADLASEVLAFLNQRSGDSVFGREEPDRRHEVRRWGNPIEVWIQDPDSQTPERGVVVNRSDGGLGVVVGSPLQTGKFLKIRAAAAPRDTDWILVEIRHCQPVSQKVWLVGCRYVGAPAWNAVTWLG